MYGNGIFIYIFFLLPIFLVSGVLTFIRNKNSFIFEAEEMKETGIEYSQLVVFDSLKFISNKSVFEFFANVYNKLNRNNPELLKQLRESIK